ncbi:Chitin synthase 3 [Elsinoe australis]|uniref:Chitin synthase 3 n=1 Tax=Elsinoe australis TaxID=40998 RepID=A0A2P8AFJ2_9PEZI|nr:Chitin synthase 3 [Elsinoe australis]
MSTSRIRKAMDALEQSDRGLKRLKQEVEDMQTAHPISQSSSPALHPALQVPAPPTGPAASRTAHHPTTQDSSRRNQGSGVATSAPARHKIVYPDELKDVLVKVHNQLGGIQARVNAMERKVGAMEAKFDDVNKKLDTMNGELGDVHKEVSNVKGGMTELSNCVGEENDLRDQHKAEFEKRIAAIEPYSGY